MCTQMDNLGTQKMFTGTLLYTMYALKWKYE